MLPVKDMSVPMQCVNYFSDVLVLSSIGGTVAFLFSRIVTQLDMQAAIVYGAITGAAVGAFHLKNSNLASKIVCIATIVLLPVAVCQNYNLNISVTHIPSLALGGGLSVIVFLFSMAYRKLEEKYDVNRKRKLINDFAA